MPKEQRCPKCGQTKLANSRLRGSDNLIARLLPLKPKRCLRCYQRFWSRVPFFESKQRRNTWLLLLLIAVLWVLFRYQLAQFDENNDGAKSQASRAVVEQDDSSQKSADNRNIVKAVQFTAPDEVDSTADSGDSSIKANDTKTLSNAVKQEVGVRESQLSRGEKHEQQLKQRLAAKKQELESLLKIEVNHTIENWRQAWQQGDVERYLSYYARDFSPANGKSRADWEAQRRLRVKPNKGNRIELTQFKSSFSSDHQRVKVAFQQEYRSSSYRDVVAKTLELYRVNDSWKIRAETTQ